VSTEGIAVRLADPLGIAREHVRIAWMGFAGALVIRVVITIRIASMPNLVHIVCVGYVLLEDAANVVGVMENAREVVDPTVFIVVVKCVKANVVLLVQLLQSAHRILIAVLV